MLQPRKENNISGFSLYTLRIRNEGVELALEQAVLSAAHAPEAGSWWNWNRPRLPGVSGGVTVCAKIQELCNAAKNGDM